MHTLPRPGALSLGHLRTSIVQRGLDPSLLSFLKKESACQENEYFCDTYLVNNAHAFLVGLVTRVLGFDRALDTAENIKRLTLLA
jgi:hypothetical protein